MGLFSKFKKEEIEYSDTDIVAIADATLVPVNKIQDSVFSKELLGQTIAFELNDNTIVSPCNGVLEMMYPTGHAFAVRRKDGMGILVHVGINTVNLKGQGFKLYAKQGEKVKAGQKLLQIKREKIKEAGYDLTTMLIISEPINKDDKVEFSCINTVKKGQVIN
ncbi:MAG: PTS glucose transporter subunit IIA [Coprobacillus sp.]|nr:PTS glucose transporter subunit IIA [Coprobacillus sp.]